MNDDELISLVREQRAKVPMTTPVAEIVRRGRALRARRQIPRLAGALAVAAGAAVVVTGLAPGQGTPRPSVRLAAWTVTKQADGDIFVTVRELADPAGLQATLRADGIAARVEFVYFAEPPAGPGIVPWPPASCQGYRLNSPAAVIALFPRSNRDAMFVIHPSAIPNGVGVAIEVGSQTIHGLQVDIGIVQVSKQCTGS
jgi:ribosomal protein L18E